MWAALTGDGAIASAGGRSCLRPLTVGLAGAAMLALAVAGAQAQPADAVQAKPLVPVPANGESRGTAISADGRFVAFNSFASNLVAGDTKRCSISVNDEPVYHNCGDVFVRDRLKGRTERVSISGGGEQANGDSVGVAISADGRFAAFYSRASNLVRGDTNGGWDVFLRDRTTGTTERVSVRSGGGQAVADSTAGTQEIPSGPSALAISAGGRFVVFTSASRNLVAGDSNETWDVFVRDRLKGTTERVNVSSGGEQANADSGSIPAISPDGRFVVFNSYASNLVAGDKNGVEDVFVRDRLKGTTERVSVGSGGEQAKGYSAGWAISADGRFVAFGSWASNLAAGDMNGSGDVFVRDRLAGTTELVSISASGRVANGHSFAAAISADGRLVAFLSSAPDLVAGDTNGKYDVFVRDRLKGTTERVSVGSDGEQANDDTEHQAISGDGRFVVFESLASNLTAGDTRRMWKALLRDRQAGTTELVSVGRVPVPQARNLALRPWPARAGRQLSAEMPLSVGGDPVASARVTCTATLAGRALRVSERSFRASTARCDWQIPAGTRGTRIAGWVSATTAGGTASRRFTCTVR